MTISYLDLALRLTLVVLLCGAVGLEREARDQPAGVRTHVLVGMGAAVFTLISVYGFSGMHGVAPIDPTRVAAQVVTGVGFLGAGAIIHNGMAVRGLTTAAAVWISAAIGMATAVGFYALALTGTAVVLIALLVFRHVRSALLTRIRHDRLLLEVRVAPGTDCDALVREVEAHGAPVMVRQMPRSSTRVIQNTCASSQLEAKNARNSGTSAHISGWT